LAALRERIQNISRATFARPGVAFITLGTNVADSDGIETSPHNVPTVRSLFQTAIAKYPHADTYTYVNSDIAVDSTFVATADAVAKAAREGILRQRFLVVGRRTNVNWSLDKKVTDETFLAHFKAGQLFWDTAEDYFMVSASSFKWDSIPPFIVGKIGYDNWLVGAAGLDAETDVVDATETLRAMHLTEPKVGNIQVSCTSAVCTNIQRGGPGGDDMQYNMKLIEKERSMIQSTGLVNRCGKTTHTRWKTALTDAGDIKFVRRAGSCVCDADLAVGSSGRVAPCHAGDVQFDASWPHYTG